jgi:hypothetical protein
MNTKLGHSIMPSIYAQCCLSGVRRHSGMSAEGGRMLAPNANFRNSRNKAIPLEMAKHGSLALSSKRYQHQL